MVERLRRIRYRQQRLALAQGRLRFPFSPASSLVEQVESALDGQSRFLNLDNQRPRSSSIISKFVESHIEMTILPDEYAKAAGALGISLVQSEKLEGAWGILIPPPPPIQKNSQDYTCPYCGDLLPILSPISKAGRWIDWQ